jgi:hypothetical protein
MTAPSTPIWRKSSYSNGTGGECVEVATLPTGTAIRDSKSPNGPTLTLPRNTWTEFVRAVQGAGLTS